MRTKTIETVIDRGFWALLLILPMLAYLVMNNHNTATFISVMQQFPMLTNNLIYSTLVDIFGSNGIIPFVDSSSTNVILLYLSYFVSIELIHIIVDVLLFIPKCCVALLDKASNIGKI